ncbi:MAG TPA: hypothetical protein VFA21_00500 [Pyrinomonadaceae bacterium]|nr:hypothetical protein [Pyrinomonadaceae bacterium]
MTNSQTTRNLAAVRRFALDAPRASLIRAVACAAICVFAAAQARAQIKVSPDGVNVSTQTPVVAFLTFGNLNNQVPAEATWCGELMPAAPDIGFKCNPATVFGVIPARYDRTTQSGTRGYTDIMTLPASVARRAYEAAAAGAQSSFFFVRRFVSTVGGPDEFVVVTCRMTGGMSGSPFSLTDVRLGFAGVDKPILFAKEGEKLPRVKAEINYTGSGRLKGRWEVVQPGEDQPEARDLLTEASLPVEQRGTQRRYTQLSRFNVFLPPGGKYTLEGPDSSQLPTRVAGEYLLLLRVEASDDEAGESDLSVAGTGQGLVSSGAVAGFPLPVLHYFVGAGGSVSSAPVVQLAPAEGRVFSKGEAINFAWMEREGSALYRLELADGAGKSVLSALIPSGVGTYRAPPWLRERAGVLALRWRVVALDESGGELGESPWRALRLADAATAPEHE